MKKVISYLLIFMAFSFCLYRCMAILKEEKRTPPKIFIIGASTVRYDYDEQRMGWGTALITYHMKYPEKGFNEARRGATAQSYQVMSDSIRKHKGAAFWQQTQEMMSNTSDIKGSYLLIQFGANDKIQKVPKEDFEKALKFYITNAKQMGLIPVLISPVETRLKLKGGKAYHSRGAYPAYVRELAYQERVLFLDLNAKSYREYQGFTQEALDKQFGAVVYPNGRIDRTHFTPKGAKIVAGWVRDLICEKDLYLCQQFKR